MRLPAFSKYLEERSEAMLGEAQHLAHLSLIDRVTSGDLGSIKYFNNLTGRFRTDTDASRVHVNITSGGTSNSNEMLIGIVEIIQRHVKDPDILDKMANDILALQVSTSNKNSTGGPVGPLAVGNVYTIPDDK